MRQFIVLGYASSSSATEGELVHLGADRGTALGITNAADGKYIRKAMFQLAMADKVKHFEKLIKSGKQVTKKKST
jgi:hypothetical protein